MTPRAHLLRDALLAVPRALRAGGLALLLAPLLAALLAGCSTQRTLVLDSRPGAAKVWVDGRYRGTTPVEIPFVHYGGFSVRMEHAGYASWSGDVGVASELDGYPVVDLPFELLVRRKRWSYRVDLEPLPPRPGTPELDAVLERARSFRARTQREAHADVPPAGSRR